MYVGVTDTTLSRYFSMLCIWCQLYVYTCTYTYIYMYHICMYIYLNVYIYKNTRRPYHGHRKLHCMRERTTHAEIANGNRLIVGHRPLGTVVSAAGSLFFRIATQRVAQTLILHLT